MNDEIDRDKWVDEWADVLDAASCPPQGTLLALARRCRTWR